MLSRGIFSPKDLQTLHVLILWALFWCGTGTETQGARSGFPGKGQEGHGLCWSGRLSSPPHSLFRSSQNGDETGTWPNNQFDTEMLQAMILASASGELLSSACGVRGGPRAARPQDWPSICMAPVDCLAVLKGLLIPDKKPERERAKASEMPRGELKRKGFLRGCRQKY